MSDSNTNITMTEAFRKGQDAKKARLAKGKAPTPQAPVRTMPQAQGRQVVTLDTAARMCPSEGVAAKIVAAYGLESVDFHAIREATEEHLVRSAEALRANLNDKALEMHLQRIVDAHVRSAHGAGVFYDTKAKVARDLTSSIANEDRDEDRPGIDNTANKAERACMFAATVGLQAYALLAAAQGVVDAYAHVTGSDWKPYEGMQVPGQTVTAQAARLRASAFDKE